MHESGLRARIPAILGWTTRGPCSVYVNSGGSVARVTRIGGSAEVERADGSHGKGGCRGDEMVALGASRSFYRWGGHTWPSPLPTVEWSCSVLLSSSSSLVWRSATAQVPRPALGGDGDVA